MVERNVLVSNLMSFFGAATSGMIDPSHEFRMRRRQLPMMKEQQMRKEGENSVKCAGKSAIPPDENNDSTLGVESQTLSPLSLTLPMISTKASAVSGPTPGCVCK